MKKLYYAAATVGLFACAPAAFAMSTPPSVPTSSSSGGSSGGSTDVPAPAVPLLIAGALLAIGARGKRKAS